jgi:hypothetical protein
MLRDPQSLCWDFYQGVIGLCLARRLSLAGNYCLVVLIFNEEP